MSSGYVYKKYMSEENRKKTAQLNVRLNPALRDALTLCATRETRSVSQQVEHFIKEGLLKYAASHSDFNPQWDLIYGEQYTPED